MPRSGAGGMANARTATHRSAGAVAAPRHRAQPVASTSKQTMEMSDDGDDDDEEEEDGEEEELNGDEDASIQGEEDDEQARDARQPNFAQYMGDSEVDEEDSDDGEDADGSHVEGEASADELGLDIDSIQQELRSIPLKTLLKAQKKLAASTASSKSAKGRRSVVGEEEDGEDAAAAAAGPGKLRKGRQISRRGMAPDLLVPRKDKVDGDDALQARRKGKVKQHRESKHAPTEMSSKRAVTRNRTVVEVESSKRRDPRFDNLSGAYDPRQFSESYAFLNDARQDEIKRLKSALHATKKRVGAVDLVEREAMHRELGRLQTKQAAYEKQQREKQAVGSWREQEDKKQSDGKKAFYLKAAQRKAIIADTRMQELQKDKRKLHKATEKQKQRDRKKDFKSAPPMRQV